MKKIKVGDFLKYDNTIYQIVSIERKKSCLCAKDYLLYTLKDIKSEESYTVSSLKGLVKIDDDPYFEQLRLF